MKISVIVPVYNAADCLSSCIDSLARQSYSDFEVIFIEDCSRDNSLEMLHSLLPTTGLRWQLSSNEANKGTGYTRNKGIRLAQGEYVFFMDQDDTITSDCLSTLISAAEGNDWPDVVMADVKAAGYRYNVGFGGSPKMLNGNRQIREAFFHNEWYEMPWNKLVQVDYIKKNGLYFIEGLYYEDTPWAFHTALTAETMLLVPGFTYLWGNSQTQKTSVQKTEVRINDQIASFCSMYDLANTDSANNRDALVWLDQTSTGYLLSVFRENNPSTATKIDAYRRLRAESKCSGACRIITASDKSRGVKAMLLYRLLPYMTGYGYLHLIAKYL